MNKEYRTFEKGEEHGKFLAEGRVSNENFVDQANRYMGGLKDHSFDEMTPYTQGVIKGMIRYGKTAKGTKLEMVNGGSKKPTFKRPRIDSDVQTTASRLEFALKNSEPHHKHVGDIATGIFGISVLGGLYFGLGNLTGAVLGVEKVASGILGILLFVGGIVGLFLNFRKFK